ncbi:hypothetical protein F2Q69_00032663 [Brassica cretica]|uniref:Uncharacterized protein n=1 Tax=Brassica cretica TaxID=69181 RepID=A0A8S9ST01_BRACR|nr:hypothetical protein F2Q69_00032663 [Brassica cretica]
MTKKAIRDIEIEQSLTAQRLLCSYFTEEQLETPVLDFFKENLPDRLLCSYFTEEQLETPVLDFFKENLPDVSIEVEDNGEI